MQDGRQELIMLLKRCAANDRSAQEEFADRSYLGTVYQAVDDVIYEQGAGDRLTSKERQYLKFFCVWAGVYERADEIAQRPGDFRESLRLAAIAITTRYLNAKQLVG